MPVLKNAAFGDRSWDTEHMAKLVTADEALSLTWFAHGDVAMRARSLPRLQPAPVWERRSVVFLLAISRSFVLVRKLALCPQHRLHLHQSTTIHPPIDLILRYSISSKSRCVASLG